jgi:subtilisin family serine protease
LVANNPDLPVDPPLLQRAVIDAELLDRERRLANGLPEREDEPGPVIVELNIRHARGLPGAQARFVELYGRLIVANVTVGPSPIEITSGFWRCDLSVDHARVLVALDHSVDPGERSIHRIWMDHLVRRLIDRSSRTVKAEAARRLFNADGRDIVWAVVDSGIDATHPHFGTYSTLGAEVDGLHRDFTVAPGAAEKGDPLADAFGHGTHVAGIIAGGLPPGGPVELRVAEHLSLSASLGTAAEAFDLARLRDRDPELVRTRELEPLERREVRDPGRLDGIARRSRLVSLKVLNDQGTGRSSDVIRALRFVRENLNDDGRRLVVHGVNLSLGYDFNAKAFASGQTPLCVEVDRLVRSGVVAVAAAGNTGFGTITGLFGQREGTLLSSINDPGNAALAITVGSTHRDMPHVYGVSWFSSKGPTGDGRLKPDLLAPGERITSCAAGKRRRQMEQVFGGDQTPSSPVAFYIDDSGTSMAAPHVSGVAAGLLSIRREFIGQPEEVKRILLESATPLGRDRYFEGHGLVNLMRAIQLI